jgi:hypothetical protein
MISSKGTCAGTGTHKYAVGRWAGAAQMVIIPILGHNAKDETDKSAHRTISYHKNTGFGGKVTQTSRGL